MLSVEDLDKIKVNTNEKLDTCTLCIDLTAYYTAQKSSRTTSQSIGLHMYMSISYKTLFELLVKDTRYVGYMNEFEYIKGDNTEKHVVSQGQRKVDTQGNCSLT